MPMDHIQQEDMPPDLGYCTWCLGVVPFGQVRKRLVCRRCGRTYRRIDPGASERRRALRYLIYSAVSCSMPAALALAAVALDGRHPLFSPRVIAQAAAAGLIGLCCAARAIRLHLHASSFESLTLWERRDLQRSLCPGMVRSDVVDALSRRGWRIGKIRSVLGALGPDSSEAA
jgi:hypothetical protein